MYAFQAGAMARFKTGKKKEKKKLQTQQKLNHTSLFICGHQIYVIGQEQCSWLNTQRYSTVDMQEKENTTEQMRSK